MENRSGKIEKILIILSDSNQKMQSIPKFSPSVPRILRLTESLIPFFQVPIFPSSDITDDGSLNGNPIALADVFRAMRLVLLGFTMRVLSGV